LCEKVIGEARFVKLEFAAMGAASSGPAAGDRHDVSGNEAAVADREERHQRADLLRLAEQAERNVLLDFASACGSASSAGGK